MDCEHVWLEKQIPTPKGGYMVLRFCHSCKETEGYGFIDKQHEINYLNTLWNLDEPENDLW